MLATFPRTDTLALLGVPYAFSQTPLLSTGQFLDEAKKWGHDDVSLRELDALNRLGLLVPFYRVDDEAITGRTVDMGTDNREPIARYAAVGSVRDPLEEGRSGWWSYEPPNDAPRGWWDGYFYSQWQLLALSDAQHAHEVMKAGWRPLGELVAQASRLRHEHLALAALASRFFPSIVGRLTIRSGADEDAVDDAQRRVDSSERLRAAQFPPARLRPVAEFLLSRAHNRDPLIEWWPVIRHSDDSGWFKLRGLPLESVWQRIAAEVLLRAHEELADIGVVERLPGDFETIQAWAPLLDRIGTPSRDDDLEPRLRSVGLGTTPRVLLVVEGKTEELHTLGLLREIGIARPQYVRVFNQATSSDLPHYLARYVSPRLGNERAGRVSVATGPTALVVAMDPEGGYETAAACAKRRAELQEQVRTEISSQGGQITQDELDALIHVRNWGSKTYELANFTDDELVAGLLRVAGSRSLPAVDPAEVARAVAHARRKGRDIKLAFQRLQWPDLKVPLAQTLLPILLDELAEGPADGCTDRPIIVLISDVYGLVQQFGHGPFVLQTPPVGT